MIDGEAGDLIFVVVTAPHENFERQGNDLLCNVTISLVEALVGFSKQVAAQHRLCGGVQDATDIHACIHKHMQGASLLLHQTAPGLWTLASVMRLLCYAFV